MPFDIDTDIPVIAEYMRSFGQHKAAMREFLRYLVRQTSAYADLETQYKALSHQTEVVSDEMAKLITMETPEV